MLAISPKACKNTIQEVLNRIVHLSILMDELDLLDPLIDKPKSDIVLRRDGLSILDWRLVFDVVLITNTNSNKHFQQLLKSFIYEKCYVYNFCI